MVFKVKCYGDPSPSAGPPHPGCLVCSLLLSLLGTHGVSPSSGQSQGSLWFLTMSLLFTISVWSLLYMQLWSLFCQSLVIFWIIYSGGCSYDVGAIYAYPWDEVSLGISYSAICPRNLFFIYLFCFNRIQSRNMMYY